MEGLAIAPDGGKLYGIMQSALLQDRGLNAGLSRVGTNNRMIEVDVSTGDVREFLYPLEDKGNGASEIVAVTTISSSCSSATAAPARRRRSRSCSSSMSRVR